MKLNYLDLTSTDPTFNLATEQYVFDSLPKDRMYFMLWRNENAIIIGKFQNTHAEINADYVREHNISVVRRLSGGGAVYHDLGNLNFTFIADAGNIENLDLRFYCQPIVATLQELGVNAEINGRNDITIDGQKFSGNSQYLKGSRVMHHGTIMFDSDLSVVGQALNVDESKIKAKGIKSVRSRVTNVRPHLPVDISLDEFRATLLKHILKENPGEEYVLTENDLSAIKEIQQQRYSQWDWNFGFSPECTMLKKKRIEGCGSVEAYLTVEKGHITGLNFYGDFFSLNDPKLLAEKLIGCRNLPEDCTAALAGVDPSQYINNLTTEQLVDLLTT
jgi:lipoate---protein ligase